ncbi:MAG: hypothetical protein ACRDZX_05250 [Acidimicrobiales bacterium]
MSASQNFLEVEKHPTLELRSTGLRAEGLGRYAFDPLASSP